MARFRQHRPQHRRPKRRILITGQGKETEPNYFRGLRQERPVQEHFVVKVAPGKGETPLDAVQLAIELKDRAKRDGKAFQYDEVRCVLDVERPGQNPQLGDAQKLARDNDIHVALSNPAFEVWILAHFGPTAKFFLDCAKVIEQLHKRWQGNFGRKYEKNDPQIYQHLSDRVSDAVGNARWVYKVHFKGHDDVVKCNSATEVYQLVGSLLQPPE